MILLIPGLVVLGYLVWTPGTIILDGRHDRSSNGIWIQHGWLGDDNWFKRNNRDISKFRDGRKIKELADLLAYHGIRYVFPHLCPCEPGGRIASVDHLQTERFLDHFKNFEVLPWVGGVLNVHCSPQSEKWRVNFVSSILALLRDHPGLAGVQVNIEPMPNGNPHFLTLLDEIRRALPQGKILSVAAYPPPTKWHPFPDIHWDDSYFGAVAQRADQLAVMMYDTALMLSKPYQHLMATWTEEVLKWVGKTHVLLGVPAYDDAGVGYHLPRVENLENAIRGIHTALSRNTPPPDIYSGISIYCEWEMDEDEWAFLKREFERKKPQESSAYQ